MPHLQQQPYTKSLGIAPLNFHSNPNAKRPLPASFTPGSHDVICARGSRAFNHEGNRRFRDMVKDNMEAYKSASTKLEKSIIVSKIVDDVRTESPHYL